MARVDFKARWNHGVGEAARTRIVRALQKQEPISELTPFETIEGRADLRGFHDAGLRGIRGAHLARIDFSHGDLPGLSMTDCLLHDLQFRSVSMRDIRDHGNRFDSCQFDDTSFRGANLGLKRSQFVNCTFSNCDFARLRFGQAEFDQCCFDSCRLREVDFGASSFERVTFRGMLEDVWFRGRDPFLASCEGRSAQAGTNRMVGVSFADAELTDVTFSDDCPLSQVILPPDGNHRMFDRWPTRVALALESIRGWNEPLAWNYVAAYAPHSQGQSEYIVNRNSMIRALGSELGARVFDALESSLR